MALKGKQVKPQTINLNTLKTGADASSEGKIMVFDENNALVIYDPLVFGASSVNMTGSVVVTGGLDVAGGTITSFDTVDLSLADNIIQVASSAGSAGDGGFTFTKNGGGSVDLLWNETESEWKVQLAAGTQHVIADVAAMEAADGVIQSDINQLIIDSKAAEASLSGDVQTEASDRFAADQVLSGTVNGYTNSLGISLGDSETALSNEEGRSSGARGILNGLLTTEVNRAKGEEASLRSAITGETARATGVEGGLSTDISNETIRAEGKESELDTLIQNEITRAKGEEQKIHDDITGQTAARIYSYDSLDFEIGDIRYGDLGDPNGNGLRDDFTLGQHQGAFDEATGTNPEMRTIHSDLTLTLSDASTVSTNDNIQSFTAYTENDAKVAEANIDHKVYNQTMMDIIISNNYSSGALSNYVDSSGDLTTAGVTYMGYFDNGMLDFEQTHKMINANVIDHIDQDAYQNKWKSRYESYSHTVTVETGFAQASGTLIIPALEKISDNYNANNISGYWGVQSGGVDLRGWANSGEITAAVNGVRLSEDAVSYNVANKDGIVNTSYSAVVGVNGFAIGGDNGNATTQITEILIDLDKVGYDIELDDVITITYDKMRGDSIFDDYSPDAEVTECGDESATNFVPNAFAYDNLLCDYTYPTITVNDNIGFRFSVPSTVYTGQYTSGSYNAGETVYAGSISNAVGVLTIEVGTVDVNGNPIQSWTYVIGDNDVLQMQIGNFSDGTTHVGVELNTEYAYQPGVIPNSAFTTGSNTRHYFKVNASGSENPYYGRLLIAEFFNQVGASAVPREEEVQYADRVFTYGGAAEYDFIDNDEVGAIGINRLRLQYPSHKEIFPDGIFELGKHYYFFVV